MRRTAAITAALIAASSIALIAPAAQAAPVGQRLTAVTSCDGGGQVKLVSSVDASGTQHGKATVRGVREKHWAGELLLGLDENNLDDTVDDIGSGMRKYTAKHGGFTASGEQAGSNSPGALGTFVSKHHMHVCEAGVMTLGAKRFVVIGTGGGIAVKTGRSAALLAFAVGDRHHRYRFTFTVHTKVGVKQWTSVRTASTKLGLIQAKLRNPRHLPSFSEASVTVTDLTKAATPLTFKLMR